jgi:purine-binding chemotaxis protein CheW
MHDNTQDAAPTVQQLTFNLAGEEYGVDILSVREIRGWSRVTRIPQTPEHLLGAPNASPMASCTRWASCWL